MVNDDDDTSKEKEIDKLMALISLDNSPWIHKNAGYEGQRSGTVAGAWETKEAGILLNANQADWKDDTDDESDDQELEAHYMYMAKLQQVSPDVDDSGPIFDTEPEQKVQNDDHYDVFAIKCHHTEQSESAHNTYLLEQDAQIEQIDQNDKDVDLAKERELLASLIAKLKCEIDESKNRNTLLETSNKVLVEKLKSEIADFKNKNKRLIKANNKLSEVNDHLFADLMKSKADAQIKLYKTREDKDIEKVIDLENKVKVLNNIVYKTGQSVQTMSMLNNKCRTSFAKPEYLKKAKQANLV
nr:hypothetical protein [Tanacetum cinerariifolium]